MASQGQPVCPPAAPVRPANCIVCGEARTDGITVCGAFICTACEREMVMTDVSDARYAFFVERLRQIWAPR
ncbi:MAG: sigma factor G inhibitor Gin [Chloroflexi bacterium]|uniref:Inhibitor of sigma-G Gin protein n=1 Tax=Alicyclobacillus cellulosilyticus TaxID=1003997 RepID=A0A917NN05_9BACL|nr:sigma factor G inhibitor Gin [Alicyclobacillus cellulosilyticus]MBX6773501.1 sigma factor G inhibitor Gin [Chloroflexota bacterium]GGJ13088.1 hypothetical protein GCM10010885_22970 [Alicyclobacillus cellulosilyticus]